MQSNECFILKRQPVAVEHDLRVGGSPHMALQLWKTEKWYSLKLITYCERKDIVAVRKAYTPAVDAPQATTPKLIYCATMCITTMRIHYCRMSSIKITAMHLLLAV